MKTGHLFVEKNNRDSIEGGAREGRGEEFEDEFAEQSISFLTIVGGQFENLFTSRLDINVYSGKSTISGPDGSSGQLATRCAS